MFSMRCFFSGLALAMFLCSFCRRLGAPRRFEVQSSYFLNFFPMLEHVLEEEDPAWEAIDANDANDAGAEVARDLTQNSPEAWKATLAKVVPCVVVLKVVRASSSRPELPPFCRRPPPHPPVPRLASLSSHSISALHLT
jgi:hypothetical protein